VTTESRSEHLSHRRYVTLLLRLLVDESDKSMQGQVSGLQHGQERWVSFRGRDELLDVIDAWVAHETAGGQDIP
jgi:hypothetical protein